MYYVQPMLNFGERLGDMNTLLALLFVLLGSIPGLSGVIAFVKHKTTVNPHKPQDASKLVTSGIYQFTRNPMYLGLLLWLIGWGIYLASIASMILVAGFVLYMNRYQILPEEEILVELFGEEYLIYKQNVRRWF